MTVNPPDLTGDEILVRHEVMKQLPQVDALILDIDGVLLDVSRSFPVVVSVTTQYYFERILQWTPRQEFILPSETCLFKQAGGYNSDEEMTFAGVLLYLTKSVRQDTREVDLLREASPTIEEFTGEMARRGGGLKAAEAILFDNLSPRQRREVSDTWNRRLILQLFQEIYGGADYCERLYGFAPEYVQDRGYVDREVRILDLARLPKGAIKFAILSGRSSEETQLALERIGLESLIRPEHRMTADALFHKPDPRTIDELRESLQFRRAIYVGDTVDDLGTVHAYRELAVSATAPVHSCQVLSGSEQPGRQQYFLEKEAEIIAPNVNSFLTWFNQARNHHGTERSLSHDRPKRHNSAENQ